MKNVIQTYLQGSRHKQNNQPCEDRTYSLALNGVDVIALADGAGSQSYPNAAIGADCVTREICKFFCDKFDELYETEDEATIKRAIMVRCQNALRKAAEDMGLDDIDTMASTLLAVAVKGERAVFCHLGDGAIGAVTDDSIKVVSAPENGEFASTTYFMTLPNAEEYIHFGRLDTADTAVYFLMSDGTCDYSYDDNEGAFHDGAAKLALMVYDKMGELKLTETVQKHLIEPDPSSDDCSFIALRVSEKRPKIFVVNPPETEEDKARAQHKAEEDAREIEEALKLFSSAARKAPQATSAPAENKNAKAAKKHNYVLIAACCVIVVAAIVIAVIFASPLGKKGSDSAETSQTTSSAETTESTTKKTVVTEPDSPSDESESGLDLGTPAENSSEGAQL